MTIDSDGEIVNAQDYYPFGAILRSYTTGSSVNDKYKFTEKERDIETNYDYFGARYYDAEIGRWLSVDPLGKLSPNITPYNYALNNPLNFIDPDGRFSIKPIQGKMFFLVLESAWTVNWAMYGFGSTYDDNIFPKSTGFSSQNLKLDWGISQFDRLFGYCVGTIKTAYEIIKTITESDDVFLKWEADKIFIDKIANDEKYGVRVFTKKILMEDFVKRNRMEYQALNGFRWLEFNNEIFNIIPLKNLKSEYEISRDLIAKQLRMARDRELKQITNKGFYKSGKIGNNGFNDTYHPRNQ
jgi:RHS repeat-associated protein